MAFANGLFTMYQIVASIETDATTTPVTFSPIAAGIENVSENMNEVVQQYQFFGNNGFAVNHVTGAAIAFTFTGRRVFGDAAQDYIFDAKYKLNGDRQTNFKLEITDENATKTTITAPCTICNIQEFNGAATDDAQISFEIRFDGEPTVA